VCRPSIHPTQRLRSVMQVNTNESMVAYLQHADIIKRQHVAKAFLEVDRGFFLTTEGASVYHNMPIRAGMLHLSAPGIYGLAVEALDFKAGHSFLNVGSGTGYVSAIAAKLLGPTSIHYGIEIQQQLVEYSAEKLKAFELPEVQLICGDCFDIDPSVSMAFDRIYVGAGAADNANFLMRMLTVGGILVGPFERAGGSQALLKCVRTSHTDFEITELLSVHFTPLQDRKLSASTVPIAISAPLWSPLLHSRFPPAHQAAIHTMLVLHARSDCILSTLPKEVLIDSILPHLPYSSFNGVQPTKRPYTPSTEPNQDRKRSLSRALRAAARAIFGSAE